MSIEVYILGSTVLILSLAIIYGAVRSYIEIDWGMEYDRYQNQGLDSSEKKNELIDQSDSGTIVRIFDVEKDDKSDFNKNFVKQYFDSIIKAIGKTKNSIIVLDYLAHNKPNVIQIEEDQQYHIEESYEEYFLELEKKLAESEYKIKYQRILQLPVDISKSSFEDKVEKLAEKCAELIYFQTFEHIRRLQNYPHFELYLIEPAIRESSIMIIDEKIILSEYDRLNKNAESYPDILFIEESKMSAEDDVPKNIELLIKTHLRQWNKVLKKKQPIPIKTFLKAPEKRLKWGKKEKNNLSKEVENKLKKMKVSLKEGKEK